MAMADGDKMTIKKDYIYQFGFMAVSVVLTAIIFLMNTYAILPTNIPMRSIIAHIFLDDSSVFFKEYSNYSAPYVCTSTHIWSAIFLPMLASTPSLLHFAEEMKGNYRLKIARIGSFKRYWNRVFFKSGLLGAGCVTAGYVIFSMVVFAYFPHMSEYPIEASNLTDSYARYAVRRPLDGILNRLFNNADSELLYWIPTVINVFAYSFLVAVLCLLLYLLITNRYKAIGMPMIVFYLVEQFSSRRISDTRNPKYYILCPRYLFIHAELTFSIFKINGLWYLVFFALAAIAFYFAGRVLFRKRVMI